MNNQREMEHQRATREFTADFKRQREEWKATKRERMEEENHRIKEYTKTQDQRQEVAKVEKRAQKKALDKVQRALAEQIKRDREEREEQEQAIRREERDEKDLVYLGNDFKNEFQRRQINMQHPDGWDN